MLTHLRALDVDVVGMDEAHRRLTERNFARRFACFTFDDGYRDNRDFALPVMREFGAPFTVYVASDFAEGCGRLWWIALERVISAAPAIEVPIDGAMTRIDAATPQAKRVAFGRMHDWLRSLPGEKEMQAEISALCVRHGVDETGIARELCMSWDELRALRRRSAGHHRRAHHHPLQSRQAERDHRLVRACHQPGADRGCVAAAGRASRLSLWRPDRRRTARIRARPIDRLPDRGDDPAGHAVSRKRRPYDRLAAGLAERQLPGRAAVAGPDLRRRHRGVERFPPHRRGVISATSPVSA